MTWDYTKKAHQTQAKADPRWHLERLVAHLPVREKIPKRLLETHLLELKNITAERRAFLELILWGTPF